MANSAATTSVASRATFASIIDSARFTSFAYGAAAPGHSSAGATVVNKQENPAEG